MSFGCVPWYFHATVLYCSTVDAGYEYEYEYDVRILRIQPQYELVCARSDIYLVRVLYEYEYSTYMRISDRSLIEYSYCSSADK